MGPDSDGTLDRALALVRHLRAHCDWDARQTPRSLIPYLIEESFEAVDAIQANDPDGLAGELGDLLLNLAFQMVIGEETGHFTADEVVSRLEGKMRRRHPHLFGLGPEETWETLKAREAADRTDPEADVEPPAPPSLLSEGERGLEPLLAAYRMQARVARVGFDWEDAAGAMAKVTEELEEVRVAVQEIEGETGAAPPETLSDRVEEDVGDLLFSVVNVARLAGVHPTAALRRANGKFRGRFQALEALARVRGIELEREGLEGLDRLWDEVKRQG